MPFLPEATFNPSVSKVVIMGPTSGDPKSYKDPKSVASIGAKLQAMTDQASADTLYDVKTEGFRGRGMRSTGRPWGTSTPSFELLLIAAGIYLILLSIHD